MKRKLKFVNYVHVILFNLNNNFVSLCLICIHCVSVVGFLLADNTTQG